MGHITERGGSHWSVDRADLLRGLATFAGDCAGADDAPWIRAVGPSGQSWASRTHPPSLTTSRAPPSPGCVTCLLSHTLTSTATPRPLQSPAGITVAPKSVCLVVSLLLYCKFFQLLHCHWTRSKFLHEEGKLPNRLPLPLLPCLSLLILLWPHQTLYRPLQTSPTAWNVPQLFPTSHSSPVPRQSLLGLLNIVFSMEPVTQGGKKGSKEISSIDETVGRFKVTLAITRLFGQSSLWTLAGQVCPHIKQRLTIHSPIALPLHSTVPLNSWSSLSNTLYHAGHF